MQCQERAVHYLSWSLIVGGLLNFLRQLGKHIPYGRYAKASRGQTMVPSKLAWLVQELPSFLVPILLMLMSAERSTSLGHNLLLGTFCLHYFHRAFIYSLLTRGTASPLSIVASAMVFCSLNGFLQGHCMLHCVRYDAAWSTDIRFLTGLLLFFAGMVINIHSDHILRNLRKPGELLYKIPKGGMFELVSGANFFGEILEWWGFALATWTLPGFSFALFTTCSIGPRAYHHHRYYLKNFDDYPKTRKALIPFLL